MGVLDAAFSEAKGLICRWHQNKDFLAYCRRKIKANSGTRRKRDGWTILMRSGAWTCTPRASISTEPIESDTHLQHTHDSEICYYVLCLQLINIISLTEPNAGTVLLPDTD
jgi:hypothetical protein